MSTVPCRGTATGSPTLPPSTTGGGRIGPWVLGDALAPGAFRATDAAAAEVVVKVPEPTAVGAARARREAAAHRALGGGGHPALVATAGIADADGGPVVATSWVPGECLDRLAPGPSLPAAVVAALLAPVADALAWIHHRGWVHGDVSAANVVVGPAGPCLVDLGSARPSGAPALAEATPAAAAPEVLAGAVADPSADVWSLAAVAAGAAQPPLPEALARVVERALLADPVRRPTAVELAEALREAAGATPVPDTTDRPGTPARSERTTVDLGIRPSPPPLSAALVAWPFVAVAAVVASLAIALGWVAG